MTKEPIRFVVSHDVVTASRAMAECLAQAIGNSPASHFLAQYLNLDGQFRGLYRATGALGLHPNSTLVEIGSGMGARCLLANALYGCKVFGVEPAQASFAPLTAAIPILARANPHLSFVAVDRPGEQTQLPTGCADVVACFEVLEHVTDPRRVLVEIRRLLRSGGRAVISTSNYASFYEGHYRLPWVPFMNHRCASTWVRMWGANPAFLSEVNLLTWHWLNRTASALGFVVRTSWRTPSCPPPILNVVYDRDIQDIAPLLPTVLQTWIQRPIPHRLLSLIGLQYKICVELTVQ